jgi:hypothetical protein
VLDKIKSFLFQLGLTNLWRFHLVNIPRIVHPLPVFVAGLAFFLFGYVGQLHEIYLSLIEHDDRRRFLGGLLLVAVLSGAIFASYLALTQRRATVVYGAMSDVQLTPVLVYTRLALALLCGAAPLLGVFVGVWRTQDLLAKIILSSGQATASGAVAELALPGLPEGRQNLGFENPYLSNSALFAYTLVFSLLCSLFVDRPVSLWQYVRVRWKLILLRAGLISLVPVAIVFVVLSLPRILPQDNTLPIALPTLIRLGQYYSAATLCSLFALVTVLYVYRHSKLAARLVMLSCLAIAGFALFILPSHLEAAHIVRATQLAGPLAMMSAQCITLFTIVLLLYGLSRRTGIPLILILVTVLLFRAYTSAQSTRQLDKAEGLSPVEKTAAAATAERSTETARAFQEWLKGRQDLIEHFANSKDQGNSTGERKSKFPVFVIAAQGGGIYAASAAATFLARMQDICPSFSRHVFAISGVSGGAVGAALFGATVHQIPSSDRCVDLSTEQRRHEPRNTDAMRWVLTQDYLSPVLGLIMPEYAERLLVTPLRDLANAIKHSVWSPISNAINYGGRRMLGIFPQHGLTRASALEASFACAMAARPQPIDPQAIGPPDKTCSGLMITNGMGSYLDHFPYSSHAPALLLNTTFVETGQRVAFSPFGLKDLQDRSLLAFKDLGFNQARQRKINRDTLAEAAVASARFPGLMPAYQTPAMSDRERWNFVDGGYADNSGAATAAAIVKAISALDRDDIDIRLIILTDEETEIDLRTIKGTDLIDTRAPIEALLNVRSTLAAREVNRAIESTGSQWDYDNRGPAWKVGVLRLDQTNFSLQLGWTLSRTTNHIVSLFVAKPEYCPQRQRAPDTATPSQRSSRSADGTRGRGDEIAQHLRRAAQADARLIIRNACLLSDIVDLMRTQPSAPPP